MKDDQLGFPTPEEIVAAMTKRGGWTRATLAGWGVPWPPPKGWRKRLETNAHERGRRPAGWSGPVSVRYECPACSGPHPAAECQARAMRHGREWMTDEQWATFTDALTKRSDG